MAERVKKQNAIQTFFRETSGELRKVSWPTRADALHLTWMVLLVMVVMGLYLGLVDAAGHALINALIDVQ